MAETFEDQMKAYLDKKAQDEAEQAEQRVRESIESSVGSDGYVAPSDAPSS